MALPTRIHDTTSSSIAPREELSMLAPLVAYVPETLAPLGLTRHERELWLRAPIGGEPLFRRLVEPLVRLGISSLPLFGSVLAEDLARLLERSPCFGIRAVSLPDPLPSHGPGSGFVASLPDLAGSAFRSLDKPASLMELARRGLYVLAGLAPPAGSWRGSLLLGARSRVGKRVLVTGRAAVGRDSLVRGRTVLGPDTVIGRHCFVGAGARLESCVLLDGSTVRPGEVLEGVVRLGTRDLIL